MKTSTTTALASILRTTPANCIARARALKLTASCRRCKGSGSYAYAQPCYDCGGSGHVLAADATERATAMVASGELGAYVARIAAKKAPVAPATTAADAQTARARRSAAWATFCARSDAAREAGLDDAADLATDMAVSIRRAGYACFSAAAVTANARTMEDLANALAAYVLDHDAEVIAARAFAAACREADGYFVEVTIYG